MRARHALTSLGAAALFVSAGACEIKTASAPPRAGVAGAQETKPAAAPAPEPVADPSAKVE